MSETFRALSVTKNADGSVTRCVVDRRVDDLPPGDVLIDVHFSSLNYKDALSASGNTGVTKHYPHTPGIDAAGVIRTSEVSDFTPGDEVIVTGYDLGCNTVGGFGQCIRVPASWVIHRPKNLSLYEAMCYGTAGFTAALCLHKLQSHSVTPPTAPVVVTGATGGVGSVAVALLSQLGYDVIAVSGKHEAHEYLRALGAKDVMDRQAFLAEAGKPLLSARWAGGIDTVGGDALSVMLKSTKQGGAVAACGNAASAQLHTSIYPFILRGVSLLGVDASQTPMLLREHLWKQLAGPWRVKAMDRLVTQVAIDGLEPHIVGMLGGKSSGRVVVRLR